MLKMNFTNTGPLDLTERRPRPLNSIRLTNPYLCPQNYNPKSVEQERYNNRGHLDSLYALGNQNVRRTRRFSSKHSPMRISLYADSYRIPTAEERESTAEFFKFLEDRQNNDGGCYSDGEEEKSLVEDLNEEEKTHVEEQNEEEKTHVDEKIEEKAKTNEWEIFFGAKGGWVAMQTNMEDVNISPVREKEEVPGFKTGGFFQEQTNPFRPLDVFNPNMKQRKAKTGDSKLIYGSDGALETESDINISPVCNEVKQPRFKSGGFQEQTNPHRSRDVFNPDMKQRKAKTGNFEGGLPENEFLERNSSSRDRVHFAEPSRRGARSSNYGSRYRSNSNNKSRYNSNKEVTGTAPYFSADARPQAIFGSLLNTNNCPKGNLNALGDFSSTSFDRPEKAGKERKELPFASSSGIFGTTGRLPVKPKPQQEQTKKAENNSDRREYSDDVPVDKSRRFEHRGPVIRPSGAPRKFTNRNNNRLGTVRQFQDGSEPQNVAAKPNRRPPTGARPSGKKKGRRPNAHRPSTSDALGHGVRRGVAFTGNGDAQPITYLSAVLQNDRLRRVVHKSSPALYNELVGYVWNAFGEKLNLNK